MGQLRTNSNYKPFITIICYLHSAQVHEGQLATLSGTVSGEGPI